VTAAKPSSDEILCRDGLEKYSGRKLLDELRQTLIGRSGQVPTTEGSRPFINLDNSASTPTFAPIWTLSARHGGSPGRYNKRSFRRSGPFALMHWVRRWLPTM